MTELLEKQSGYEPMPKGSVSQPHEEYVPKVPYVKAQSWPLECAVCTEPRLTLWEVWGSER